MHGFHVAIVVVSLLVVGVIGFRLWVRRCLRRIQDARIQSTHVLSQIEQQRSDLEHASIKEKQILSLAIQGVVERGLTAAREIQKQDSLAVLQQIQTLLDSIKAERTKIISEHESYFDTIQRERAKEIAAVAPVTVTKSEKQKKDRSVKKSGSKTKSQL
jgi:hypothetical protein